MEQKCCIYCVSFDFVVSINMTSAIINYTCRWKNHFEVWIKMLWCAYVRALFSDIVISGWSSISLIQLWLSNGQGKNLPVGSVLLITKKCLHCSLWLPSPCHSCKLFLIHLDQNLKVNVAAIYFFSTLNYYFMFVCIMLGVIFMSLSFSGFITTKTTPGWSISEKSQYNINDIISSAFIFNSFLLSQNLYLTETVKDLGHPEQSNSRCHD